MANNLTPAGAERIELPGGWYIKHSGIPILHDPQGCAIWGSSGWDYKGFAAAMSAPTSAAGARWNMDQVCLMGAILALKGYATTTGPGNPEYFTRLRDHYIAKVEKAAAAFMPANPATERTPASQAQLKQQNAKLLKMLHDLLFAAQGSYSMMADIRDHDHLKAVCQTIQADLAQASKARGEVG